MSLTLTLRVAHADKNLTRPLFVYEKVLLCNDAFSVIGKIEFVQKYVHFNSDPSVNCRPPGFEPLAYSSNFPYDKKNNK